MGLPWLFVVFIVGARCIEAAHQPHIVMIIADDMGWNDVGFHGSNQIPTPNIDALAYNGVILNSHYVLPICTPSRAALMTGKYPIHTGMQGFPLGGLEPKGLPAGKLLPEYLKELGYSTNLIGKWHLGHYTENLTPTQRGFDSHLGYYNGFISYYDFIHQETSGNVTYFGYDMRRNMTIDWDDAGQYATEFFTNEAVNAINSHNPNIPLFMEVSHLAVHAGNAGKLVEAPQDAVNKVDYIVDANRRTYAAMVSKMDDSVGEIVAALKERHMLENSIIIFMADNGAPTIGQYPNWGSNWPLRGIKETLWEGGVRGAAFIWSPLIQDTPRVSTDLFHISDWLPTLYAAGGGDINVLDPECDGIDQWSALAYNFPSPRSEILLNIDEKYRNAALRFNNWKLLIGSVPNHPEYDNYYGESGTWNLRKVKYNTSAVARSPAARALETLRGLPPTREVEYARLRRQATIVCLTDKEKNPPSCNPSRPGTVCLYDISSDPCEEHDLSKLFPYVVRRMKKALVAYRAGLVPQLTVEPDLRADPRYHNYTWSPWEDSLGDADMRTAAATATITTACTGDMGCAA